jgi:hypothetical protein
MLEGENRMNQDADKPTLELSLSFGKISAVVAAMGAAIYALGFVALWVPIARLCTEDFPTAWYAASLVTNVLGLSGSCEQITTGARPSS